jgi:kynureninase
MTAMFRGAEAQSDNDLLLVAYMIVLTEAQARLLEWLKQQKSNHDGGWVIYYPGQGRVMRKLVERGLVETLRCGLSTEFRAN